MDSFDRPKISATDVREIARLYSVAEVASWEDLSGIPNVTVALQFPNGEALVVRVCNNGYTSVPHLIAEMQVLTYLAESGYPYSPRLSPGLNGEYVQYWDGYRVIAMERIFGLAPQPRSMNEAACAELGRAVGELSLKLKTCEVQLPDREAFDARTDRLIKHSLGQQDWSGWPLKAADLLRMWSECSDLFNVSTIPEGLIHSDIWPPNVLVDNGGRLTGIVDFDDLAKGPVVLEIAATFAEFAVEPPGVTVNPGRGAALLQGYLTRRSLTTLEVEVFDKCIVASYIGWLCCNVFHAAPQDESEIYANRLELLSKEEERASLRFQILTLANGNSL